MMEIMDNSLEIVQDTAPTWGDNGGLSPPTGEHHLSLPASPSVGPGHAPLTAGHAPLTATLTDVPILPILPLDNLALTKGLTELCRIIDARNAIVDQRTDELASDISCNRTITECSHKSILTGFQELHEMDGNSVNKAEALEKAMQNFFFESSETRKAYTERTTMVEDNTDKIREMEGRINDISLALASSKLQLESYRAEMGQCNARICTQDKTISALDLVIKGVAYTTRGGRSEATWPVTRPSVPYPPNRLHDR